MASTEDDRMTSEPKTTVRTKEDWVGHESNQFGVPIVPKKIEKMSVNSKLEGVKLGADHCEHNALPNKGLKQS